jgi:hypothetical protein
MRVLYCRLQSGDLSACGGNRSTILNSVDQQRINDHASLTIETTAQQEQAILDGIKAMQQNPPAYSLEGYKQVLIDHGESTCASNSISLLKLGGIDVSTGPFPQSPKNVWNESVLKFGQKLNLAEPSPRFPNHTREFRPGYDSRPVPGQKYGRDPRGQAQARTLDRNTINNGSQLIFRNGRRIYSDAETIKGVAPLRQSRLLLPTSLRHKRRY